MAGSTSYPGGLDDFSTTSPTNLGDDDSKGRKHSERHDDMEAAVEAIEAHTRWTWSTQSAPYNVLTTDAVLDVTGTTTVTLPAVSGTTGKAYTLRNTGAATVTIDGNASEQVGGATTQTLAGKGYLRIVSNGSAWLVVDGAYWDESVGRRCFAWDSVNSRWQMVYGDTGWRDVSATLTNSWAGNLWVRRVGHVVHFRITMFDKTSATSDEFWTTPSGWQPGSPGAYVNVGSGVNASNYGYVSVGSGVTGSGLTTPRAMHTNGTNGYMSGSYVTADAWPASLPGSASGSIPTV